MTGARLIKVGVLRGVLGGAAGAARERARVERCLGDGAAKFFACLGTVSLVWEEDP